MRLLLVDNYDSFTHNLAHRLAEAGAEPVIVPNDTPFEQLPLDAVAGVVLSPGPGRPDRPADFGVCRAIIERCRLPILGVCLGHQGIGAAFGARVVPAPRVMHGRLSTITHGGDPLFAGVPQGASVVRYHSLCVVELPPCLAALARADDGVLMALRHRQRPLWGVQFHPESICTPDGPRLLANFVGLCRGRAPVAAARRAGAPPPRTASHRLIYRAARRVDGRAIDPEAAFIDLFAGRPGAFWLDTAGGGRHIMGVGGPTLRHRVGEGRGLFDKLRDGLAAVVVAPDPQRPFPFTGGWVGCLGYGLEAECGGPRRPADRQPDAVLMRVDRFVVIDGARAWAAAVAPVGAEAAGDSYGTSDGSNAMLDGFDATPDGSDAIVDDSGAIFDDSGAIVDDSGAIIGDPGAICDAMSGGFDAIGPMGWLDAIARRLADLPSPAPPGAPCAAAPVFRPARDAAGYRADIARIKAELTRGETYEACLTTRLHSPMAVDGLAFHRRLRRDNPAPYAALLEFGDVTLVSASPERFLRVDAWGAVETKPIKGTRAREADPVADAAARDALLTSEKDRAENLMICDLLRNDLARVCRPGSVQVPRLMHVESYATVHQLVSTVRGQLRHGATAVDCAQAAFPGGSMTGAPKIRTMAILADIERAPRGLYSGALGWFGFDGAADLSIVIRTAVIDEAGCSIGVGGAIVALSDPEAEIAEMQLKARALIDALGGRLEG